MNPGLAPENLAKQIDELYYFLERNEELSGSASIPQICDKINMIQEEKRRVQDKIAVLESRKHDLEKDVSEIRSQKLYVEAELGLTKEFKEKLKADGFEDDEIPYCIDLARIVKGSGYRIHQITEVFSTMSELETLKANLEAKNTQEGFTYDKLVQENTKLSEVNSRYSQRLRELEFLYEMGFGLPEFKQLRYIIDEIAEAHGLPTKENAAVKWFLESIVDHHYDYLDLGKAVNKLRSEIKNLTEQRDFQLLVLGMTPDLKIAIDSLLRTGIKKDDIERISRLIKQNCLSHFETSPDNSNSSRPSGSSKLTTSDSKSEQDRENSRDPRSVRENVDENSWAIEVAEKGDVDRYQNGSLLAEDNFFGSGNDLNQEGKNWREREEEKSSRLQSMLPTSDEKRGIENYEEVQQPAQEDHRENDIIGFLQSFISPSLPDNSAHRDSEKGEYDSVKCPSDSRPIMEDVARSASTKHDLVSQSNVGGKLYAWKERRRLGKTRSSRLPIPPPSPPNPRRIRIGEITTTPTIVESTQTDKTHDDTGDTTPSSENVDTYQSGAADQNNILQSLQLKQLTDLLTSCRLSLKT